MLSPSRCSPNQYYTVPIFPSTCFPIIPSPYVPSPYVPQSLYNPQFLCSPVPMLPKPYGPVLFSPFPMPPSTVAMFLRCVYMSLYSDKYSPNPPAFIFSEDVDQPLCSPVPMFPKHIHQSPCSPNILTSPRGPPPHIPYVRSVHDPQRFFSNPYIPQGCYIVP